MADSRPGGRYEIVVGAALEADWAEWFDGFEVETDGETSRLVGSVVDQAALHGLLARLRDLGLPILELRHAPTDP